MFNIQFLIKGKGTCVPLFLCLGVLVRALGVFNLIDFGSPHCAEGVLKLGLGEVGGQTRASIENLGNGARRVVNDCHYNVMRLVIQLTVGVSLFDVLGLLGYKLSSSISQFGNVVRGQVGYECVQSVLRHIGYLSGVWDFPFPFVIIL